MWGWAATVSATLLQKVPPARPQVDTVKLRQAVRTVLFNQFFISLPMLLLLYPVFHRWADPCRRQLPTFQWFLLELAVFTVLEEVLFYYSHRYVYIWGKGFF